jgi:hypothetical protein
MAEHTGLGSTVILGSEAAIRKLLDDVSPGALRLIEWNANRDPWWRGWRNRPTAAHQAGALSS